MKHFSLIARSFLGLAVFATSGFSENTHRFSNGLIFKYPGSWTTEVKPPYIHLIPEGTKRAGRYLVSLASGITDPVDPRLEGFLEREAEAQGFKRLRATEERILNDKACSIRTWNLERNNGVDSTAFLGVSIVPGGYAMAILALDESAVFETRRNDLISLVRSVAKEKDSFNAPPGTSPGTELRMQYLIWRMGREVTQAALLQAMQKPWQEQFGRAEEIARVLKITVPPMPAFTGTGRGARLAEVHSYVLMTAGPSMIRPLKEQYGSVAGGLFELGLKSILLVGSAGKDPEAKAFGDAMQRASRTAGLPDSIIQPLLDAIQRDGTSEQLTGLILELDGRVGKHFAALGAK